MKTYLIEITCQIPYPKKFVIRQQGNHHGTAINRAIATLRRQSLKGKRIRELSIKAVQL
jgi:hypothetical protein